MKSGQRSTNPVDILLVEDDPSDIRLTKEAFKDGQTANTHHIVEDGVDAFDFLFQRNDYADAPRPDLVLLDLNHSLKERGRDARRTSRRS